MRTRTVLSICSPWFICDIHQCVYLHPTTHLIQLERIDNYRSFSRIMGSYLFTVSCAESIDSRWPVVEGIVWVASLRRHMNTIGTHVRPSRLARLRHCPIAHCFREVFRTCFDTYNKHYFYVIAYSFILFLYIVYSFTLLFHRQMFPLLKLIYLFLILSLKLFTFMVAKQFTQWS